MKNKEEMAMIKDLAKAIDSFAYDFDTYEYRDQIDDRDSAVAKLIEEIEQGNVGGINDWFLSIVKENNEFSPIAQQFVDILKTYEQKALMGRFLDNPNDTFAIFQLKSDGELRDIRFESLNWVESVGRSVMRENYDLIYTSQLTAKGLTSEKLDKLYYQFNNDHPEGYKGHSLSVSDVVALKQKGTVTCHYVDRFGFQELPSFLKSDCSFKNERPYRSNPYLSQKNKSQEPEIEL